jgi:hypothetical protein
MSRLESPLRPFEEGGYVGMINGRLDKLRPRSHR